MRVGGKGCPARSPDMPVEASYLEYAYRRYGMDHSRYAWSMLTDRVPIAWPDGARLAVWINVPVQFFPLNQRGTPFAPPGGMVTPYPDLRHYTLRDYGNRVGIPRCLAALDRFGLTPTFSINAVICELYPRLLERLCVRGDEILCQSWHMDSLHHGELGKAEEAEIVARSLEQLRAATDQAILGWVSPGRSQSSNTPDLLAENGVQYMGDWINDELPYLFHTDSQDLVALPLSLELDDQFVIGANLHSEWEYADQIKDACDFLLAEARESECGRLLALTIHPWLMGQPHRIAALESVLEYIANQPGVWSASSYDIVQAWRNASGEKPG